MIGFQSYRGRNAPQVGDRVCVYRNLNRYDAVWWSISGMDGLVSGHALAVTITDATAHVGLSAQASIAAGGPRSVHAWVRGTLAVEPDWTELCILPRVLYHPHESAPFRRIDDRVWTQGATAAFTQQGMFAL